MQLTAINRFPVKSCRGEPLESAALEPWGLAGDRRWMIVGADGDAITAREYPPLLLVRPQLTPGGLRLRAPGQDDLEVVEPSGPLAEVTLFGRRPFRAALADDAAHAWFSGYLGVPCRLVYQDDPA